jgi:ABC-type multidrug transport system fused ATPase/permease subunit
MGVIAAIFTSCTVAMIVFTGDMGVDVAAVGFTASVAIKLADCLTAVVKSYVTLEMDMDSLDRMFEYCMVHTEDGYADEQDAEWSPQGCIEVLDLTATHAPELQPVLRGVTFCVSPGQRLGILGRTGAGKSSLALALARFLDVQKGMIRIDGVDIRQVQLRQYRRRVSLIPQTPVLFSGTIRSNLDPFCENDDLDIIDALRKIHWFRHFDTCDAACENLQSTDAIREDNYTAELSMKQASAILQTNIAAGGLNISQGQRQLLCLARAIVARPKVVILDEITSSVDTETDHLIQRSLKTAFHGTTIIAISHRLQAVVDFDRILVLEEGRVAEFGAPLELIARPNGAFRAMVEEHGKSEELRMTIAQGAER